MTILYSTLATIYHEMYQHIFDYDKEFAFYNSILKPESCRKILEIGCGSGMLARRLIKAGYDYTGLDLHSEMLDIARKEVKSGKFIQGDMRTLSLDPQFDALLITGRSLAYVIDNKGILGTMAGVGNCLKENGIFVFGVFEANSIFDNFDDFNQIIQHNDKTIQRISTLKKNLATGFTYDWTAKYIVGQNGLTEEFDDFTTLRAFTKDEISLFLKLSDFSIREIIEEAKAFTIVATKN